MIYRLKAWPVLINGATLARRKASWRSFKSFKKTLQSQTTTVQETLRLDNLDWRKQNKRREAVFVHPSLRLQSQIKSLSHQDHLALQARVIARARAQVDLLSNRKAQSANQASLKALPVNRAKAASNLSQAKVAALNPKARKVVLSWSQVALSKAASQKAPLSHLRSQALLQKTLSHSVKKGL